tara:strand:+ start:1556 stop:2083 length:528 start_codon:yes stop_codon:yes gene_type:complete
MNNRIKVSKNDAKLEIVIKAFLDKKKQQILLVWILLFSLCGIAIFAQFFEDYDAGTKVFFGVYVAFWIFFEFKVIYAYRWRKYGEEKIIIDQGQLILIKTIGKRGVTQQFKLEEITKIDFFKDESGAFAKSMNTSYWNINKYHMVLKFEDSIVPFGIDLDNKDAKNILNELRKLK